MEPLIAAFLAAGLAEFGDKSQLMVIALAAHYRRPGAILAGTAAGAAACAALAAAGGAIVHDMIMLRAAALLLGVALLYAGVAGLLRVGPQKADGWKMPAAIAAAGGFFIMETGDRSQFLILALAAQFDAPTLAGLGGAAGIVAANAPAALLGERMEKHLPLRAIRIGAAAAFLLFGSIVTANALRLI